MHLGEAEVGPILKISHNDGAPVQRWTLCGQLAGPWVAELKSIWERWRAETGSRRCLVDLSDVTAIDEHGEELLRTMQQHGAEFVARGIDLMHTLEHLQKKRRPPLRKFLAHLDNGRDCL